MMNMLHGTNGAAAGTEWSGHDRALKGFRFANALKALKFNPG
jgi:hypothetical protein